ncbi:zinc-ribbon domain-containing protein [Bremerella alba]|uniref:Zinc finger/thioredoxin putative domain-containing protein n=1 Tax=Bremerella alba TaxID=980252 RepID=A0A7V9A5W8_9BACT|nr:zinc-ribbon domain-containing protein [Bremerella alba]MBA2113692.1 hypothetical protein [Bremerella alba]
MAKLHITCPNCSTRYPVADEKLAGRRVTCKKCSEKFVAEIESDAVPALDPFAASSPASDPLGDDLFGDFTSSSAAASPALGSLPPKKRSSSSGSFPVIPLVLGGVGVLVVVILVVTVISFASGGSDRPFQMNAAQQQFSKEDSYKQHFDVTEKQFDNMLQFLTAIEAIQSEEDLKQFDETVRGLTQEMESLTHGVRNIPPLPKDMQEKLKREVRQQLDSVEGRAKAAGQKLAKYTSNARVAYAAQQYHQSHSYLGGALGAANTRSDTRREEVDRQQAIKYAHVQNPQQLPQLLYEFALADYAKAKQVLSVPMPPDQIKNKVDEIKRLYQNIREFSQDLANIPAFHGNVVDPAIEKYKSDVQEIHDSNHFPLEGLATSGLPFIANSTAKVNLGLSNEIRGNWETINGERPHADSQGKVGPMFHCFTPEELDTFVQRHQAYKYRMPDRRYVVMFIDERYGPEIEKWKALKYNNRCEEMSTKLMKIIWKPSDEGEDFHSMVTSGYTLKVQEIAGENVVVMSYDESVLKRRDDSKSSGSRGRLVGGLPFGGMPDIRRPRMPQMPEPGSQFGPRFQPPTGLDSANPPREPTAGPRGPRFGSPGMPNMGSARRDPAQEAIERLEQQYGKDKLVRLEFKTITSDQAKQVREIIRPWSLAQAYVNWLDPEINQRVIMFPYDGDIDELASKITFGEVDEVLAKQRRIRLKSVSLP